MTLIDFRVYVRQGLRYVKFSGFTNYKPVFVFLFFFFSIKIFNLL